MLEQDNFKKKLNEIERQNEAFEREKKKIFDDLGLTPALIHEALKDPSQYSESEWQTLQSLKKDLDEQLRMKLDNIRNVEKSKKNLESLSLPPWALFCK